MPPLKSKFKNVYLAGEHLSDWQGFMEGAINSREEAADEIIRQHVLRLSINAPV